ncbi:sigma-70 family RNA polymerase sigma factor [Coleofasciculus sp. FACHB-712]|uniref:sigma-70 family RNA polymerase sigma factor n=1 Tax=Cyanophyceae TaxID=3028117 RepID=UPI001689B28D|nr:MULTISPECIES: sigma-70 family RNA polymerase sigma factor [unclassified Coleofasciculus]MBD1903500.1 sigma-70 family RNA polymerase sigma factor [Coleofasciculus sp. FACHB-125]MBD1944075.1 sigma-70 family RNA polymerase sigma factor [Coleofasciculus sp. FACHB-712]
MNKTAFDELDEQLKQLAKSAQQHPPLAQGRQLALRKLLNGILQSGRLCRPQWGQFSGVYEDIYDEARQELLLYICQNIDKYDPERGGVMAWANVLLERRFFKEAIPKILGSPGIQKMTLADLDNFAVPESPPVLNEILTEYIESDPEKLFQKEHIVNHPKANFRALVRRRILGDSWKQISAEFGIKIPTISSFYYRCLNKFSANLKEYYLNNIA